MAAACGSRAGRMMIGDNQFQPEPPGCFRLSDAADAAVDGDDQRSAAHRERFQRLVVQAVAFVDAMRHVIGNLSADERQAFIEQRRAGNSIGVVIAIDDDRPSRTHRLNQSFGGFRRAGQLVGLAQVVELRIQKHLDLRRVMQPRAANICATTAETRDWPCNAAIKV